MAIVTNFTSLKTEMAKCGDNFLVAYNYLEKAMQKGSEINYRILNLPVGSFNRINLSDEIYALEQVFLTKERSMCFFESHLEYIDFQLVIEGVEQMEHVDVSKLKIMQEYNRDLDLIKYEMIEESNRIVLGTGDVCVFFSHDAHLGCGQYIEEKLVRKTVVKLPIRFL